MDDAQAGLRGTSPTVLGLSNWGSCRKTSSPGRVGVSIKAVAETRVVGRLVVVCIRRLAVLLPEVNVIGRGTGLGISFNGLVLVG